jgi:hypothetical protein
MPQAVARLTVYADLHNFSDKPVSGTLKGTISRPGKPTIELRAEAVSLSPGETREVAFAPDKLSRLGRKNPDLWWPYTMGNPIALRPASGVCGRTRNRLTALTFALEYGA